MLVGHEGVTRALSSQLPPVSIIKGPQSVGKRMIAAHAAMSNNIARTDFTEVSRLTVGEANRVKDFMRTEPSSNLKFALIDLDQATDLAVQKLLKALEEPPKYARFSLISSKKIPSTLLTRGHKYTVGLLNPTDLFEILIAKGVPELDAVKVSKLGRVDLALEAYSDVATKAVALNVLQAVETSDYVFFTQTYKAVDDKAANMIIALLEESAAQNWKLFNPEYLGAFANKNVALTILAAWSNLANARPKLAVRAALESVMRG
jgi:DNA polymerase III delta prime subunit